MSAKNTVQVAAATRPRMSRLMPVSNRISALNHPLAIRNRASRLPQIWGVCLAAAMAVTLGGCKWAASGQNATGARLYEQGQYSAAMQQFQKVIITDPANADGYYNLAATNHALGNQRHDAQQLERAEALYNQCLDYDSHHVECHRGLAVLLIDTGRPDRAFALMKNWAAQNPALAEPRIELARLYEEANDQETALRYLEDAVQKDPNSPRAWLALGRLREQSGDYNQAVQNYQRSLAIDAQPQVQERVTMLNRQLNANYDATAYGAQTQIANQPTYGGIGRY
jgi:tetratricopeptide (TPR) repeat protein